MHFINTDRNNNLIGIIFSAFLFIACFCGMFAFTSPDVYAGQMTMTAINTGRGDSILIESDGKYMLVDAGIPEFSDDLVTFLKSKNITKFDYIVSTHPDGDHVGGFAAVFENFEIGKAYYSPCTKELDAYYDFLQALRSEGCPYGTPVTEEKWTLGDATIEVLYDGSLGTTYNECSLVLRVTCDNKSILLMGDLPSTIEKKLMNQGVDFDSDVLKVGHHGAAASSCADFLDAVSPKIAVISCAQPGETSLPKDSVLQRLARRLAKVYRTSDGNVTVNFDNGVISTTAKENNPFVSLRKSTITLSENVYTSTGKELKPAVTVTYNGAVVDPSHYKITYSKNIHTGLGKVKITGTNVKYVSTNTAYFKILPYREEIYSCAVSKFNRIKLTWKKQSTATSYTVQYSKDKKFKKGVNTIVYDSSKSSATLPNLSYNKKYFIRIRAYTEDVGVGKWSKTASIKTEKKPIPEKAKITTCKLTRNHHVSLKWKKSKLATGYILQYTTDKKFKKSVTKKVFAKKTKTSYTIKGLKTKTVYYIRVRAYRKDVGKGKWSTTFRIRF